MTYISFDGEKLGNNNEFDGWVAYKYLCPNAKNPWMVISESANGTKYGLNLETLQWLKNSRYKYSYFAIASEIEEMMPPQILGLYVACKPRRVTFRPIYNLTNSFPQSEELNPDSIGESVAHLICTSQGH